MKKCKAVINKAFDILEIHFPALNFSVLFLCYVVMIAYRYIFYASLNWIYETSMIAFVWCCLFAASYGSRAGLHVSFTILYDKFSEKGKLVVRLAGNLIIISMFLILIPYAYDSMSFSMVRKTSIIGISYGVIYFPFLAFAVMTVVHHVVLFVKDVKQINQIWKCRPGV